MLLNSSTEIDNRLIYVYMFNPKYIISNKLLRNIKRITEIITNLNNQSFSNIVLTELEKRAREISTFSSTSIEGNP